MQCGVKMKIHRSELKVGDYFYTNLIYLTQVVYKYKDTIRVFNTNLGLHSLYDTYVNRVIVEVLVHSKVYCLPRE